MACRVLTSCTFVVAWRRRGAASLAAGVDVRARERIVNVVILSELTSASKRYVRQTRATAVIGYLVHVRLVIVGISRRALARTRAEHASATHDKRDDNRDKRERPYRVNDNTVVQRHW